MTNVPEKQGTPPDERVGYRCPPKQHQFRKGQSGNPRGARKRGKFSGLLEEPRTIIENGQKRKRSPFRIQLIATIKQALDGNLECARHVFDTANKYGLFDEPAGQPRTGVLVVKNEDIPWELHLKLLQSPDGVPTCPVQRRAILERYLEKEASEIDRILAELGAWDSWLKGTRDAIP